MKQPLSQMDFRPLDFIDRIKFYWWVMVVLMLLGSAGGYGISLANPPKFETRAVISVAIDYTRTGFLTDIEEDQTVEIVGDVISSDEVIQDAITKLQFVDEEDFREKIKLERKNNQWLLKVIATDPYQAAIFANAWVEAAFYELEMVREHATKAEYYQRYLDSLASCLEETASFEPAQAFCSLNNLDQLSWELEITGKLVDSEKMASRGIMPAVSFTISQTAVVPNEPVRNNRGQTMLSSALAGFLISLLMFWLLPSRGDHTGSPEA